MGNLIFFGEFFIFYSGDKEIVYLLEHGKKKDLPMRTATEGTGLNEHYKLVVQLETEWFVPHTSNENLFWNNTLNIDIHLFIYLFKISNLFYHEKNQQNLNFDRITNPQCNNENGQPLSINSHLIHLAKQLIRAAEE